MPTNQEKVSQLLADSHFAFINSQNNESLHLANEAIRLAPKKPDAYQCAGDAYMSLGQKLKCNCMHIIIILLGVVVKYNCINSDYY
ncbi:hypothetical protein [uncultured Ruminococcus sp.]|uniref:hypothetical protein n=1 Tax=uncultured Ruminococcus sp. TaxID=165186 RepID=UPI0026706D89|nr:hypothetical protein [uncultured Ruminococcus sp.]